MPSSKNSRQRSRPEHARRSPVGYAQVWDAVGRIPRGRVSTYGRIARLCGLIRRARFIGYALHGLPPGTDIPWHRVINSRGEISFPPSSRAAATQRRLLENEGIRFRDGRVDLARFGWPAESSRPRPD